MVASGFKRYIYIYIGSNGERKRQGILTIDEPGVIVKIERGGNERQQSEEYEKDGELDPKTSLKSGFI